jgi:hypothetical protein
MLKISGTSTLALAVILLGTPDKAAIKALGTAIEVAN